MGLALAVAAVLAVVIVVFVARPFLRDPAPASDRLDAASPPRHGSGWHWQRSGIARSPR